MVEVARRRVAGYGDRAHVLVADMRRFRVPQRFDMAVIGMNTFMHLLTSNDQLDCLACIHEHLRAAGVLLLDLANPHTILRDLPLGMMQHRFTRPSLQDAETTITLWSATSASPAEQIAHSHLFFDEVAGQQGAVRRTMAEVTLRLTYRYELELLLARSGFAIRHVYGDYDSSPYDDDGERLICVAVALA